MQNEEGAKDSIWESTGLWDRDRQGRNEKEGDTKLPVKTKIRDTDKATQFFGAEVKQTQSSKLFPLKFFAKHKGNVDISTLPPL